MNARVMLAAEYIKASRRTAFIVTTILFAALMLTIDLAIWYEARLGNTRALVGFPNAWGWIMGEQAQMSGAFLAVIVLLIVSAEFSWRTARQNVIDGMSKNEWFFSKMLLIAALCVLYGAIVLGIGGTFAALSPANEFIRLVDVYRMGAYALSMLGFASLALMLAMLIRNPGPAVAVLLFWILMVENMLEFIVEKFRPEWEPALSYLPVQLFFGLFKPITWYPEVFASAVEAAGKQQMTPPDPINIGLMMWAACAYVSVFLLISYVDYSRRDL